MPAKIKKIIFVLFTVTFLVMVFCSLSWHVLRIPTFLSEQTVYCPGGAELYTQQDSGYTIPLPSIREVLFGRTGCNLDIP